MLQILGLSRWAVFKKAVCATYTLHTFLGVLSDQVVAITISSLRIDTDMIRKINTAVLATMLLCAFNLAYAMEPKPDGAARVIEQARDGDSLFLSLSQGMGIPYTRQDAEADLVKFSENSPKEFARATYYLTSYMKSLIKCGSEVPGITDDKEFCSFREGRHISCKQISLAIDEIERSIRFKVQPYYSVWRL